MTDDPATSPSRPSTLTLVLAGIGIAVAALLLLAFLRNPGSGELTDRTWQLVAITGQTPAYQGVIASEDQPRYAIRFDTDGTFTARADCNTVLGGYEVSGRDGLTITPGPSTLVACPDGSYGSLFVHALSTVESWSTTDDQLTLTTTDGGTGTFIEGAAGVALGSPSPSTSATATESAAPTPSPSPSPTASPSPSPSPTPSPTAAPTAAPTETAGPTGSADATVAPTASAEPTPSPTPSPSPEPTPAPTPEPSPTPGDDLIDTSWQLATYASRDPEASGEVPAAERAKYTLAFAADGTFSSTADCNTINGSWVATADGGLTITPAQSTIVACPEGSYSDLYILALTSSQTYAITDGLLDVTLRREGTLGFEPTP